MLVAVIFLTLRFGRCTDSNNLTASNGCFSKKEFAVHLSLSLRINSNGTQRADITLLWNKLSITCADVLWDSEGSNISMDQIKIRSCFQSKFRIVAFTYAQQESGVFIDFLDQVPSTLFLETDNCSVMNYSDINFLDGTTIVSDGFASSHERLCSGSEKLPHNTTCFTGASFGVTLRANITMLDDNVGDCSFIVSWGLVRARCPDVLFSQNGQFLEVNQTALADCLPSSVSVSSIRYCSDQEDIRIEFAQPLPVIAYLPKSDCSLPEPLAPPEVTPPSGPFTTCTGEALMPNGSLCYSGPGFGVTLSSKFKVVNNTGAVVFALSWGAVQAECQPISFQQTRSVLLFSQQSLAGCLPNSVGLQDARYCSDQDKISLDFIQPLQISLPLSRTDCSLFPNVSVAIPFLGTMFP